LPARPGRHHARRGDRRPGPLEQGVGQLAGGPLLGLGVAVPGLLGQRGRDGHPGAAQLGDPVGLVRAGQELQGVGHGGPRVLQAAIPQGGLGQSHQHRRGVLGVRPGRDLVEDGLEIGPAAGQVAGPHPQRPPDGQRPDPEPRRPEVQVEDLVQQPLGLLPTPQAQQRVGRVGKQARAVASQGAELADHVGAGQEDLDRVGGTAGHVQDGGQAGVDPAQVVDVDELDGDAAALLQVGDALLHVPEESEGGAEGGEGVALHGPGADLPGHRDRLLAAGQCLGGVVQQHEQLAVGGQGAGQLLGRRLGRDDGHRPLDGGHGQGRVGGRPVVAGQPLQQRPGPPGLGGRVDPVQGQTAEGDGPLVVAGQVGRLGGPVQHRAPVQGAAGGRLRHLVPQLQGALVVPEGLGQGRGRLGGLPGLHAGHQRLPQVVGGVPVVGELATLDRPGPRPARSLALLNAALQRPGVGGVQRAPLHRQQVVVDRLLDQAWRKA